MFIREFVVIFTATYKQLLTYTASAVQLTCICDVDNETVT